MDPEVLAFLTDHRVARLATADAGGKPHIIPVCYAFDGRHVYSAVDLKPKRVSGRFLKRVRNILENPMAALIVDDYSEDWSRLGYVLVQGEAEILDEGGEQHAAAAMLRRKYSQYGDLLEDDCTVIKITPKSFTAWGRLRSQSETTP